MKPVGKKLLIAFFSLLLLIYIGYQAYLVAYEPYETVVVKEETYTKSLELEGFFVRDEAVLKTGQSGIIGYQYKSGEKVPINAEIARIYEKEADLYALEKIDALTQQRDILNQLQNSTGGEGLKIDLVSQQLADAKYSLMRAVDTGDLSNIDSLSNEILLCLNQYALCIGEDLNITNVIGDIDSEIASLQSQIPNAVGSVKTERSGYFCSTTDGLEEKFSFSSLENLTVADAEEMLAASVSSQTAENVIGKMTYSNGWKFVAVVPASEAAIFKEGATETFSFAAAAGKETSVTVERIITEENAEKAVVIFSGMDMDNDFLTMRFENPRVL